MDKYNSCYMSVSYTHIYENQEQLEEFLQDSENTKLTEKYDTFIKKYMSGCDGHSCERLAGLINSYVGRCV